MSRYLQLPALAILAVAVIGCSDRGPGGPQFVSRGDADKLNADRNRFEASEDPPFNAETHYAAGRLSETQGNLVQAMDQYKAALKLNSKHLPSIYRLGILYAQSRQFGDSVTLWERYVDLTNGSAAGYANLGYTQELAGNLPAAEKAYLKGIEREPSAQACRINLGLMLARRGRLTDAETHLLTVLPPAQAHYNLGGALEQAGNVAAAKEQYRKALLCDPACNAAQVALARLDKK